MADEENIETENDKDGMEITAPNPCWADAMARVLKLKKPKKSRSIILSYAKKSKENVKSDENVENEELTEEQNSRSLQQHKKKENLPLECRVKPNILDRERERKLKRMATKGVVQLFNAVHQQQKKLETELKKVGPSELRKDKVLKSLDKQDFLNILKGTALSETVTKSETKLEEEKDNTNSEWQVLHEDFMLGSAKLRDWDKNEKLCD